MGSEGLGELSILPDQWWCLVVSEIWNRRKHTSWNTPRKRQSSCVVKSVFSEKILRLIHLFERLLLFYFPIIWSNRGIQTKQFSINGWVCRSFDFSLQETEFSASKRTWSHNWARDMKWLWKKAQRKFYFFSVFVAVVFVSRKQNQVNFIFSVRLKNCAVKSFLGWTFFPFVRINEVLFYLQRWQVWLLPICRRNISAAIKRQSSALSDF